MVWLSRPSRQSGIYNFNNGKQLIMGGSTRYNEAYLEGRGVEGSPSLLIQGPLEDLQPGCEPRLVGPFEASAE